MEVAAKDIRIILIVMTTLLGKQAKYPVCMDVCSVTALAAHHGHLASECLLRFD